MDRNPQGGELTVGSYDQLPDLDNFLISKFNDLETGILSIFFLKYATGTTSLCKDNDKFCLF